MAFCHCSFSPALAFYILFLLAVLLGVQCPVFIICISLITNEVGHLSILLKSIWMKDLFKLFAHFSTRLFVFFLLIHRTYILWIQAFIWYLLWFCGFPFYPLIEVFSWAQVLHFNVCPVYPFFKNHACFLCPEIFLCTPRSQCFPLKAFFCCFTFFI